MSYESQSRSNNRNKAKSAIGVLAAVAALGYGVNRATEANNVTCEGVDSIVVQAGDTYWEYARNLNPRGELRTDVITHEIQEMNPGHTDLKPGEVVNLPLVCKK